MYKILTKRDIQKELGVPESYNVDGLVVVGTHPKEKEYSFLYEALDKLNFSYNEEKIKDRFFSDIKSFVINGKRIWFDVVYGSAYLSEVVHFASILGSQANILIGTCGALKKEIQTGEKILPFASYGNESATRMYQRENNSFLYQSDTKLRDEIKGYLKDKIMYEGNLMTVQAMLGETYEDVKNWANEGYCGVDMESSILFAVSEHFNVPSAALLYSADNLIRNELVTDKSYKNSKEKRVQSKRENFEIAFNVVLDWIK